MTRHQASMIPGRPRARGPRRPGGLRGWVRRGQSRWRGAWARRAVRTAAAVLAAAALGGGVVTGVYFAGRHDAFPAGRIALESGEAWVTSEQIGSLTLLDGVAGRVVASVQVAVAGESLSATQAGANAFAVDQSEGTLVRVDGSTLMAGDDHIVLGDTGATVQTFVGNGILYAVDGVRGTVTRYDAADLHQLGGQVLLAGELANSTYTGVVDPDGRLWLLNQGNGDLVWMDPDGGYGEVGHRFGADATLSLTEGRPAVADPASQSAYLLGPGGSIAAAIPIALTTQDQVVSDGSPAQSALLMTSGTRGVYQNCPFALGHCEPAIDLPTGHRYGPAVEASGYVFIPDYTTGGAWVLDPSDAFAPRQVSVLGFGAYYQLFADNGLVFYNDPADDQAGTLSSGGARPIPKYATAAPSASPAAGGGSSSHAPVRSAPPSRTPDASPGAGSSGTATAAPGTGGASPSSATPSQSPTNPPGLPFGILHLIVDPPSSIVVGDTVTVSAQISGGPPDAWQWTVTDQATGTVAATSTGSTVSHDFTTAGTYLVTLQVEKVGAASAESTATFTVTAPTVDLHCGELISSSVTLEQDLNCSGDGLIIDGNDLTLDLHGHTVTGDGSGDGITLASGAGPVSGVTVENGTVTDFDNGLYLGSNGAEQTQIDAVQFIKDGTSGQIPEGGQNASAAAINFETAVEQSVSFSSDVIDQKSLDGFVFNSAAFNGLGTVEFTGTSFQGGEFNIYTPDNWSSQIPTSLNLMDDRFVNTTTLLADLEDSTFTENTFDNSEVVNSCIGGTTGVSFTNNTFTSAINALTVTGMSDEEIEGNTFQNDRIGMEVDIEDPADTGIKVQDNHFLDNGAAGLVVEDTSGSSVTLDISGNVATHNGDAPAGDTDRGGNHIADGIHVYAASGGITLGSNTADDNAAYGIWASTGEATGSGNTATGDPDGCLPASLCG